MGTQGGDIELDAIQTVLSTLEGLAEDERGRVLDYVFRRLGLALPSRLLDSFGAVTAGARPESGSHEAESPRPEKRDIRSLKEEKEP